MSNKTNYRIILSSIVLLLAYVSYFNFNIALLCALLLAFFIKYFGLLEYLSFSSILLVKSQNEIVLSSADLHTYVSIYNQIGHGKDPFSFFDNTEVILPSFFWFFSKLFSSIDIYQLSFVFVLIFIIILYPLVKYFAIRPLIAISLLLFVDINLVVHLFRQSLSSVFLLVAVILLLDKQKSKGYIYLLISVFVHSTSFLASAIVYFLLKMNLNILKIFVIAATVLGVFILTKDVFYGYILAAKGMPILGKAFHALNVFHHEGQGVRYIAYLAVIAALLFVNHKNQDVMIKIFLGFIGLSMIVYHVPILAPRVGLIASSILTGLPIGIMLLYFKSKIIYFMRN